MSKQCLKCKELLYDIEELKELAEARKEGMHELSKVSEEKNKYIEELEAKLKIAKNQIEELKAANAKMMIKKLGI